MSATNSFACRRPPATRVKVASPFGGSPRSAMRFSTPCSVALPSHRRSWSVVDPTQVRCAAVVTPNVSRILTVSSSVLSRVDPPAPYVQVTMEGVNVISSSRAAKSCASPAPVLGGKISKDRANFRSPYSSEILIRSGNDPCLNPPRREGEVERTHEEEMEPTQRDKGDRCGEDPPFLSLESEIEEEEQRDGEGEPQEENAGE